MAKTVRSSFGCSIIAALGFCSYFQSSLFTLSACSSCLGSFTKSQGHWKISDLLQQHQLFAPHHVDLLCEFSETKQHFPLKPILSCTVVWLCTVWNCFEPFLFSAEIFQIQHIPASPQLHFARSSFSDSTGPGWSLILLLTELQLQLSLSFGHLHAGCVLLLLRLDHKFISKKLCQKNVETFFIWTRTSTCYSLYAKKSPYPDPLTQQLFCSVVKAPCC